MVITKRLDVPEQKYDEQGINFIPKPGSITA